MSQFVLQLFQGKNGKPSSTRALRFIVGIAIMFMLLAEFWMTGCHMPPLSKEYLYLLIGVLAMGPVQNAVENKTVIKEEGKSKNE